MHVSTEASGSSTAAQLPDCGEVNGLQLHTITPSAPPLPTSGKNTGIEQTNFAVSGGVGKYSGHVSVIQFGSH